MQDFTRASVESCLDAAQYKLEQAEENAARLAEQMTVNAQRGGIPAVDAIAYAEMQIRLASAWTELARAKAATGGVA